MKCSGIGPLAVGGKLAGFAAGGGRNIGAGRKLEEAEDTFAVERDALNVFPKDADADGGFLLIHQRGDTFLP